MKFLFTSLALALATQAQANSITSIPIPALCGKTTDVLAELKPYHEKIVWTGYEKKNVLVVVWVNELTRTYTITKTDSDNKITCVFSVGEVDTKL